jgi:hypothetical protein
VELVPDIGAASRRAQAGDPQLGAVAVGDRLEVVELAALWRVTTTEIFGFLKPAAASRSKAPSAVSKEPGPRTASFTAASAPSIETWTST